MRMNGLGTNFGKGIVDRNQVRKDNSKVLRVCLIWDIFEKNNYGETGSIAFVKGLPFILALTSFGHRSKGYKT